MKGEKFSRLPLEEIAFMLNLGAPLRGSSAIGGEGVSFQLRNTPSVTRIARVTLLTRVEPRVTSPLALAALRK